MIFEYDWRKIIFAKSPIKFHPIHEIIISEKAEVPEVANLTCAVCGPMKFGPFEEISRHNDTINKNNNSDEFPCDVQEEIAFCKGF